MLKHPLFGGVYVLVEKASKMKNLILFFKKIRIKMTQTHLNKLAKKKKHKLRLIKNKFYNN